MSSADSLRPSPTLLPGVIAVEARSARAFGRHMHDEFGIGVLLAGAQDSASGRGPVRAGPGQLITTNPGEIHDGLPIAGAPRHWRMLYFPPAALRESFAGLGVAPGAELIHPVLDQPAAARAFLALHQAVVPGCKGQAPGLAVESLLLETLAALSGAARSAPAPRPSAAAGAVRRARHLLDEDPARDWRLEVLAARCGLSRFHFLRAFRAATGLPPHAYQVQRRVQLGRRLVLSGTPLAEAAVAAGFADQAHFNRHFLRVHGHSPGLLAGALAPGRGQRNAIR